MGVNTMRLLLAALAALVQLACGGGGDDAPQHRYVHAYVGSEFRMQSEVGSCEAIVDRLRGYMPAEVAGYRFECTDAALGTPLPWYSVVELNNGLVMAMRSPTERMCTAVALNFSQKGTIKLQCTLGPA